MSETTLKTRIQLKYDTFENWSTSELILKKGEIAICEIPQETAGSQLTPPTIGIKVGDGTKKFSELNWIQALAGDVAAWAKAATKPTYAATEITGLEDYVSTLEPDVSSALATALAALKLEDTATENEFVTSVSQADGVITVTRAQPTIANVSGLTEALAGKQATLAFEGEYSADNKVVTKSALTAATAGLTGAMHFKGTQDELPQDDALTAYAQGDVILVGTKEYVFDGAAFQEFGDAGSYAVKGSIKDADIAADAAIAQSKIAGLAATLAEFAKTEELGALAELDTVAEAQLEAALAAKINGKADASTLAAIAKSGDVKDLQQTEGDILVFDCGDSTDTAAEPSS